MNNLDLAEPNYLVPETEIVKIELDRILASPEFVSSERLQSLLSYLVAEVQEGRGERIKAFSIALDLYGRDETFDQQSDTIVRVEAGRLRRQLDKFYTRAGNTNSIRIDIPKGGYHPTFTLSPAVGTRETTQPTGTAIRSDRRILIMVAVMAGITLMITAWMLANSSQVGKLSDEKTLSTESVDSVPVSKPFVMVMPMNTLGVDSTTNRLAVGLVEALITNLTRLSGISVMAHASMLELPRGDKSVSFRTMRQTYGATHILRGVIEQDADSVLVNVQLIDTSNGETLWAERLADTTGKFQSLEDRLALRIVEKLSVRIPPGEQDWVTSSRSTNLEALVLYRQALILMIPPNDIARIKTARTLFQRARQLDPGFAGGYAGESFSHAITLLFLNAAKPGEELALALQLAEKAISVDPDFGMGYATLSFAQIFAGKPDEGLTNARQAVLVQPGDAFTQFILGLNLTISDRPEDAIPPLQKAMRLDPLEARTPYLNVLGLTYYAAGQYQNAADSLESNIRRGGPRGPHMDVFLAAAYAQLGREAEARVLMEKIMQSHAEFPIKAWVAKWVKRADRLELALGDLKELGLR
jgi:adenylate cyclase